LRPNDGVSGQNRAAADDLQKVVEELPTIRPLFSQHVAIENVPEDRADYRQLCQLRHDQNAAG
jgi:hypothetical protein